MAGDSDAAAGVRTFLIADVRGYTRYTQEHGDEAAAALAAGFAQVVRSSVGEFDGELIELRGDEALVAFASARQALRASVALQRRARVPADGADPLPLGLGIGLDSGEAVPTEGGYRGGALNLAARLCSVAAAGQVFASEGVVHLARHVPGLRFGEPQALRLKGISERVRAVEVIPDEPLPPLPAAEPPARSRRLLLAAVLVAAGVAAAIVAGVVFVFTRGAEASSGIPANTAALLNGSGAEIEAEVPVTGRPGGIAVGAGAVWVTDTVEGTVLRIDPDEHLVVDRVEVGRGPEGVAVGGGSVWVANSQEGTVSEFNPAGSTVRPIRVGNGPTGIAFGAGAVWVVNRLDATLSRISTRSGRVVATVPLRLSPSGVAAGLGAVWVTSEEAGVLLKVDPGSNSVTQTIQVGNGPVGVAVGRDAVWVANPPDSTVTRIDPRSVAVSKVPVEGGPTQLAFTDEGLWTANTLDGTLTLVDPEELEARKIVEVESDPNALAGDGQGLWVAAIAARQSHRGGTLHVLSEGGDSFDSIDPAKAFRFQSWQALSLAYDGLVGFRRVAGPLGATVVPDLATSLPVPQDGGRTYSFQLRDGIRYSNGDEVQPADVRASLERQYRAVSGLANFDIPFVGLDQCSRTRCDLSTAITVDEDARTVTLHLTEPDPNLLFKLAVPFGAVVPAGSTPPDFGLSQPLPGTGPYRIVQPGSGPRLELVRNPHFREWSRQAQPAGFPDRIVYTFEVSPERSTTEVEQGRADVMLAPVPAERLSEVSRRFPSQSHPYILNSTYYAFLDTRSPPFEDVRVRRALNYATDRAAIVRLWGGPGLAHVTCQVLPPGLQGYRPYCPYTASDKSAGIWTAPNLPRARALLAGTGAVGSAVTVAAATDDPDRLATARYFVGLLRELGFRPTLRLYPSIFEFYKAAGKAQADIQLGNQGWVTDVPRASDYFRNLLICSTYQPAAEVNGNPAGFCSPRVDRTAARAERLDASDPTAAGRLWARADREVVDAAPWVSYLNLAGVDLVAERVGNYQRNPQYGILLSQLWVR